MSDDSREALQREIEAIQASLSKETEVPKEEPVVSEQETSDPFLEEAVKMGYDPNYNGSNKKSPEQFVKDGSFFRKIESQQKKIEELIGVVKNLDEHNRKVATAEYERGMKDALSKRQEAVEEGDLNKFQRAEDEIKSLETKRPEPVHNNVVTQDMLDFVEENKSWFNNNTKLNERMVKEADGLFVLESRDDPTASQKDILARVKEKIQRLHPEAFENPNKEKAVAVGVSKPSTSSSKSGLAARLTDTQKQFLKTAQFYGSKMTAEEYAKQLDSTGDLRHE